MEPDPPVILDEMIAKRAETNPDFPAMVDEILAGRERGSDAGSPS